MTGLSVAIVTFNSAGVIGSCLAAVGRCLPRAEVIVVDNGSTDASVAVARRAAPGRVRVVACAENAGFGRACNRAAELAGEAHVLFLNPDVRLVGVDERMLAEALSAERFGIRVASMVEDPGAGRAPVPLLWRERSWVGDAVHHAVGPLRPREVRSARRAPPEEGSLVWGSAAAMIVRKEEFLGVGSFDRRFFLYYEDRELSGRYRDAGLPIGVLPGFVGVHAGGGSSGASGRRTTPKAWEYVAWLEYVAIREGRGRARLASSLTWGPRAACRSGMGWLAARGVGGRRVARKADELAGVAGRVETLARGDGWPEGGAAFCPRGRELVRRASR